MGKVSVAFVVNTVISGCIAGFISLFFAQGTIAENYTDKTFVAPEFFVIMGIWAVGFLIGLFIYTKKGVSWFLFISIVMTWASIPLGVKIGMILAT
ncbi:hypothetical protein MUN89_06035 [Halobacillus salinarum]|uniref:Uncharacterized protein n=1 Tax=Halobacillus salinarum TaxID=2932257 RepID=A0ABY4EM29_9BACI|nr:hypothetical protein [Halobacillus salinarum]UOQ45502.1 hypothetical protein MUN89_06035 [Halobacillus salinarum]